MIRRLAAAVVICLTLAACSSAAPDAPSPSRTSTPTSDPSVEVRTGATTARQAMRRLCEEVDATSPKVVRRPTPPAIAEVEDQVESVRGLRFERPVNVEPVTPAEIDRRISEYLDVYYPHRFYARRTDAWRAIGALPPGVGYLEALGRFQQGEVLGFYNSQNGELVYTGDEQLTRIEQFILAHELTHAIDDQHFDLDRLDRLASSCDDERFLAALGAVEGSAQYFSTQVILRFPVEEIGEIPDPGTRGIPPMIVDLQLYPYTAGQTFVQAVADDGGVDAVNEVLRRFPATTEEVLHPGQPEGDVDVEVDVPDFAPTFGGGWRDLDVMVAGELWLRTLLATRLPDDTASNAANGWDGGIYRAWTDGEDTVVILATVWDSPIEAGAFRGAIGDWLGDRATAAIEGSGKTVNVGFVTSARLLPALEAALRSM